MFYSILTQYSPIIYSTNKGYRGLHDYCAFDIIQKVVFCLTLYTEVIANYEIVNTCFCEEMIFFLVFFFYLFIYLFFFFIFNIDLLRVIAKQYTFYTGMFA